MNNFRSSEGCSGLLALLLCGLLYAGLCAVAFDWVENRPAPRPSNLSTVTLSFVQLELQAAIDLSAEALAKEEPPLLDLSVDLPFEVLTKADASEKEEEPELKPAEATARMTQEASAPAPATDPDILLSWVRAQIEREKVYPVAAQRAGYEGAFRLRVRIEVDGAISEAAVVSGQGHPLLRRALEKMMKKLPGRHFGQPLDQAIEIPFEISFDLQ